MAAQDVVDAMTRDWNAGSGPGWASHFAEDALFVDVLGRVQEGNAVIAREHQKIFDTIYKGSIVDFQIIHHRAIGDGLELVITFCILNVPQGPRAGDFKCIQSFVVKGDKIVSFQNTGLVDMSEFSKNDEDLAKLDPMKTKRPD